MTRDHKRHGTPALLADMNALEAPSGSFLVGQDSDLVGKRIIGKLPDWKAGGFNFGVPALRGALADRDTAWR
jgi:hypothetical protein